MSDPARLRHNRAFNLLWGGQTVNGLGSMVSSVALPLLAVSRLDASTLQVGALEAAQWAPALVLGLPAGVWADRHRRRPLMIWANLGQAMAACIVPLAAFVGLLSMPVLLLAAMGSGLFGVVFQAAYSPFLRTIVRRDHLVEANGRLRSSASASRICGPALGGALVEVVGAATAVLVDAASFLVSLGCLARIESPEPVATRSAGDTSLRAAVLEGFRQLGREPLLRVVIVAPAAMNCLLTAAGAIEIVFLVRDVGLSPGPIGVLLATGSVGGLVGALVAGRLTDHVGLRTTARLILVITSPFGLLMALAHTGTRLACFACGLFVVSFGLAVLSISFATLRQLASPPEVLGRISAMAQLLMSAAMPAGALAGGALGWALGPRFGLATALAGLTALGVALASNTTLRDGPRSDVADQIDEQLA